jgi:hypothetical protein
VSCESKGNEQHSTILFNGLHEALIHVHNFTLNKLHYKKLVSIKMKFGVVT